MRNLNNSNQLNNRRSSIKLIVFDVDGTLTDGKIYMGDSGEFLKAFDIKDGCGIHDVLPEFGINSAIITGRKSLILENRCKELGIIHIYQGVKNKIDKMDELLKQLNLSYENVAYMGDDINDLQCMEKVAIVACPHDAVKKVIDVADYVAERDGGNGAAREFIDWLCGE